MNDTTLSPEKEFIYPSEYEQASNSYLMAVVSVMAGLPLPIINLIACVGYYLANRRASYFVRWHCIQSTLGQAIMIPFNSIAFAWTLGVLFNDDENKFLAEGLYDAPSSYWMYIAVILLFNVVELFVVIYTAARVRKGHDVRWFIIAGLTDSLCSKENRDIYKI